MLIILRCLYCRQLAVLFKQIYYYAIYDYNVLTVYEAPTDDSDSQLVLFSTHFPLAKNLRMSQYRFIAFKYRRVLAKQASESSLYASEAFGVASWALDCNCSTGPSWRLYCVGEFRQLF